MNERWAMLALFVVACGAPEEDDAAAHRGAAITRTLATEVVPARACGSGLLGFDAPRESAVATGEAASIALDSTDSDAHRDLVVARGESILVARGDGSGAFARAMETRLGTGRRLIDLVTGDFDGDGTRDVAVVDANDADAVYIIHGTTSGLTAGAIERAMLGAHRGPAALAAGDFDDDGRTDLVVANRRSGSISVRMHPVAGPVLREYPLPARVIPTAVAIADLDGDARLDVVTSDGATAQLFVLAGSEAELGAPMAIDMGHRTGIAAFAVADLNGDGASDLVSLDAAGTLGIRLHTLSAELAGCGGSAGMVFEPAATRALACGGSAPCAFASVEGADIDADGFDDLVVAANGDTSDWRVLYGSASGLGVEHALPDAAAHATRVVLSDLDGDARADVLVATATGAVWTVTTRCECASPWSGTRCDECTAGECPGVGTALDEQLTVGRSVIVSQGATLVRASERRVSDERSAARIAQEIAALAHDSELVVIAHPTATRERVGSNNGQPVAESVTHFVVDQVVVGDSRLRDVHVVQAGGSVEGRLARAGHATPFRPPGDYAVSCPGAHASTGHWLLFLTARRAEHRLTVGLTEPARVVEARSSDFVLRDRESGLAIPSAALLSVLSPR